MPITRISEYALLDHFDLACYRALHSTEQNTPLEHEHYFYELVVVCSGTGINRMGGRDSRISAGSVFLIPPHQKHWYVRYSNLEIFNIVFSKHFLRYFLTDLTRMPGYQLLFSLDTQKLADSPDSGLHIEEKAFPEIVRILSEMDRLNLNAQPGDRYIVLSDFLRVILLISRHVRWSGIIRGQDHIGNLTELLSVLEEKCTEKWNLARMAKTARMGVSSFRQEFRKLTGESPVRYLLKLRLKRAVFLMESTDTPIEQIALNCGFTDHSYFSRQFLKEYHVRPSRYRSENAGSSL